ncbi:MAG TPA: hypothetical protein VF177_06580 [Anaerolineae bacterium]
MADAVHETHPATTLTRWQSRRWVWLPLLLGATLFLLYLWLGGQAVPRQLGTIITPIVADDWQQNRANTPLPPPQGSLRIQQSFYPRHNGLSEIELVLARPRGAGGDENSHLTLQLLDDTGAIVAATTLNTHTLTDNQIYTFRFPPQMRSAGRRYVLQIGGSQDNPVSVWGYDLDVVGRGELALKTGALATDAPTTSAQSLRFVTRYQLMWPDAVMALASTLFYEGLLLLLALAFIPLPGCLLLLIGPKRWRRWDRAAWWGVAFALGAATWPLLWFWFSLAGGRWSGWLLWLLFTAGWLAVIFLLTHHASRITHHPRSPASPLPRSPSRQLQHVFLLLLLLLALAVRLLAVRDIAFPPWVDSSRHALITAVMVENGRTISDYRPFLQVDRFPYHFGFHTLSASLMLMTEWPLPRLLLFLGQLLNALVPLTIYAAGWLFTRRRGVSLLAAFLVALPFFFPGYYATWGRMTQLTAMLIMPVLLALTWPLLRGGHNHRQVWWLVALLAAGLFLIHVRVFLFYLPFAAIVWLVSFGRHGRWLVAAAVLALLLLAPRLLELATMTDPVGALQYNLPNYNDFPTSYLNAGWERYFAWLGGAATIVILLNGLRWRRWAILPMTLIGWVAVLFLLLAGDRLGLPETFLVNLNSMYITLFLPLAFLLSIAAGRLWRWLGQSHWLLQIAGYLVAGAALAATLLFGLRQQITILNPQTILAQPEDLAGLAWAEDNLPQDTLVAVNSWLWLGNTWTGHDGGAWLVPLTGRATTTPPADYIYDHSLFNFVNGFNETATAVANWADPAATDWLRQQRVTHVFVGNRGGFFDPAALARNPQLEMIYSRNGVFIFEIRD